MGLHVTEENISIDNNAIHLDMSVCCRVMINMLHIMIHVATPCFRHLKEPLS